MIRALSPFKKRHQPVVQEPVVFEDDSEVEELFNDDVEAEFADAPQEEEFEEFDVEIEPEELESDEVEAKQEVVEEVAEEVPKQSTRVKTTFLGFDFSDDELASLDADGDVGAGVASAGRAPQFPTGWIVITEGPGRGNSFGLVNGVNSVGRGSDQQVCLDFGDSSISREGHMFIAYDNDEECFFAGHGGKSNLVRLNGKPLLSTERMGHGDQVKVGETTIRLVALCGDEFSWAGSETEDAA